MAQRHISDGWWLIFAVIIPTIIILLGGIPGMTGSDDPDHPDKCYYQSGYQPC
jgi:hypothetical protein